MLICANSYSQKQTIITPKQIAEREMSELKEIVKNITDEQSIKLQNINEYLKKNFKIPSVLPDSKEIDERYERMIRKSFLKDSLYNTVMNSVQIKQFRNYMAQIPKEYDEYLKQKKAKEAKELKKNSKKKIK